MARDIYRADPTPWRGAIILGQNPSDWGERTPIPATVKGEVLYVGYGEKEKLDDGTDFAALVGREVDRLKAAGLM